MHCWVLGHIVPSYICAYPIFPWLTTHVNVCDYWISICLECHFKGKGSYRDSWQASTVNLGKFGNTIWILWSLCLHFLVSSNSSMRWLAWRQCCMHTLCNWFEPIQIPSFKLQHVKTFSRRFNGGGGGMLGSYMPHVGHPMCWWNLLRSGLGILGKFGSNR